MVGVDVMGGEGLFAAAGRGAEELLQLGFHQIKRLLAAQDQRFHPVPFEVKQISMAEEMTKGEVVIQTFYHLFGEDGRPVVSRPRHGVQKLPMPKLVVRQASIELYGNTFEDILEPVVKGMQRRGECEKLSGIRRARRTLLHERTGSVQQAMKLLPFERNLLPQPIPHATVPLLAGGSE